VILKLCGLFETLGLAGLGCLEECRVHLLTRVGSANPRNRGHGRGREWIYGTDGGTVAEKVGQTQWADSETHDQLLTLFEFE